MRFDRTLVGFVDIQGFSELVKDRPLEEILSKIKRLHSEVKHNTTDFYGIKTVALSLSDSFVLTMDTSRLAVNIGVVEVFLSTFSFYFRTAIEAGIPVRGAIGAGYFYYENDILISDALVDAAEFERQQNWYGAGLTERATELCEHAVPDLKKLLDDRFSEVLGYGEIPLKSPAKPKLGYYLKPYHGQSLSLQACLKDWITTAHPEVKTKMKNSRQLYGA